MSEFVEITKAKRISFDMSHSEEETVDWKSKTGSSSHHAKYDANRRFRPAWSEKYRWVKSKNGRAFCIACKKFVFNNIAHIRKHGQNVSHCKRLKEMNNIVLDESNEPKSEQQFIKLEFEQISNEPKSRKTEEYINTSVLTDDIIREGQDKTVSTNRMDKSFRECEKIVEVWAMKLHKMDTTQQMLAERFINEIIFEGQMRTLHRNSLQLNIIETIYQAHNIVTENNTV